jgi:hypothetical protein
VKSTLLNAAICLAACCLPVSAAPLTYTEPFGLAHKAAVLSLPLTGPLDVAGKKLVDDRGREAVFQVAGDGKAVLVRTDLGPRETLTWKLAAGKPAAEGPVTLSRDPDKHRIEVANGLAGIRIPDGTQFTDEWALLDEQQREKALASGWERDEIRKQLGIRPKNPAPVQGIRLPDGRWTANGPNLLTAEALLASLDVKVVEQGPLETLVRVHYAFKAKSAVAACAPDPSRNPGYPGGDGRYTCTITVKADDPVIRSKRVPTAWWWTGRSTSSPTFPSTPPGIPPASMTPSSPPIPPTSPTRPRGRSRPSAGSGRRAIAYLPVGQYVVKQTIELAGGDYCVAGAGCCWQTGTRVDRGGPAPGEGAVAAVFRVANAHNLALEGFSIGTPSGYFDDPGVVSILHEASDSPSFVHYDDIGGFGLFRGLGSHDRVRIGIFSGILEFDSCGRSTVVVDQFHPSRHPNSRKFQTTLLVKGRDQAVAKDGLIGLMTFYNSQNPSDVTVQDSQSLVVSDYYTEQTWRVLLLEGQPGDTPGRVTKLAHKFHGEHVDDLVNVKNYRGELFLSASPLPEVPITDPEEAKKASGGTLAGFPREAATQVEARLVSDAHPLVPIAATVAAAVAAATPNAIRVTVELPADGVCLLTCGPEAGGRRQAGELRR